MQSIKYMLLNNRNSLTLSAIITTTYWCRSNKCQSQYKLSDLNLCPQFLPRTALMNSDAFTKDWFTGFVTFRPYAINTDEAQKPPGYQIQEKIGSGIIADESGICICCCSDVNSYSHVTVIDDIGNEHKGRVIERIPEINLAFIKLDQNGGENWKTVKMHDSLDGKFERGDQVFGVDSLTTKQWPNLTEGHIIEPKIDRSLIRNFDDSITGRIGFPINHLIYHNTALTVGSNASALVDTNGYLIGINIKRFGKTSAVALAVDKQYINALAAEAKSFELRSYGLVVYWFDNTEESRRKFTDYGITGIKHCTGLLVYYTAQETPELKKGSIITHVNGCKLRNMDDFYQILETTTDNLNVSVDQTSYRPTGLAIKMKKLERSYYIT
ncbi:uncharacterized protein LOC128952192 [Oppia nitens]|uniref:uncharacterized protein LOC128952192 n=1 Tax=Oppia nitens TaxID=1686743 RepID=UPI0023DA77B2|nr:uncharacterized protein LOC128952192 [Oppia nitens]